MKTYKAELYSQLRPKARMCSVTFECRDPLLVDQYAKSAAGRKGIRNVQYLTVKNVKEIHA